MKQQAVVIGAGINGLVAANYLARGGYHVTVFERADQVGGACVRHTVDIGGKSFAYPGGASVFGFMQNFVWKETGLSDRLDLQLAETGMFFPHHDAPFVEESDNFECDCGSVVEFLQSGYRSGIVPTVRIAERELGPKLTSLWITGTARNLVDHYFLSEEQKIATLLPVNESGPVSIDEPFSAFNISLMHSGSVMGGEWGYVKGGIWRVTQELAELNRRDHDVPTHTSAIVESVDPANGRVSVKMGGKTVSVQGDIVVFATEPLTAATLIKDSDLIEWISRKRLTGTSGKCVLFFRNHPLWKDDLDSDALRFVFFSDTVDDFDRATQLVTRSIDFVPGYLEMYPEGEADQLGYGLVSVFFKHLKLGKKGDELGNVQRFVEREVLARMRNPEDFIGSLLLSPRDLCETFGFAGGNIDHVEIAAPHTFFGRTFSSDPQRSFYQFGSHTRIFYCGAGAYPCGSVAGTPGYMCVKQILKRGR